MRVAEGEPATEMPVLSDPFSAAQSHGACPVPAGTMWASGPKPSLDTGSHAHTARPVLPTAPSLTPAQSDL